MLESGTEAPTFELPNQDGEPVALPEDGTVIVYFYPRADTPGCTTQACSFRDVWEEYERRGISVLGISDDPVEDLAAFAEKYELPIELLSDEDGAVATAYESYGEKNVFGNVVDGVFRNSYVVEDGEIVAAYEGVDPEAHAETLLDALES